MNVGARAEPPLGLTLVIEAATASGSLALLSYQPVSTEPHPTDNAGHPVAPRGSHVWRVLGTRAVPMGSGRQDVLTPAVRELLSACDVLPGALSAVVCGAGPGSFTSLRIAAATAKGLVWGSDIALYGVPSLLLAGSPVPVAGAFLVTMDALRDESYALAVDVNVEPDGHRSVRAVGALQRLPATDVEAAVVGRTLVAVSAAHPPRADAIRWLADWGAYGPVDADRWEPSYGRLAEAQVKWEANHGRSLPTG